LLELLQKFLVRSIEVKLLWIFNKLTGWVTAIKVTYIHMSEDRSTIIYIDRITIKTLVHYSDSSYKTVKSVVYYEISACKNK
jgi:hypothetical protein